MNTLFIRNARLVNEGQIVDTDLLVHHGRIDKIAPCIAARADAEIDAAGQWLLTAVCRRLLRLLLRRGLLSADDAQVMAEWEHGGGFSVDAQGRIEAHERNGLERLLRDCARPALALERQREIDPEHLVYESVKPGPGSSVS